MANYPGSAPSFTGKSAGETIQPAHINDLQDEVAEIGGDLVGGTIRHDLTPSTTSTRSIGSATNRWRNVFADGFQSTGASTLGNLTVTNLQVTGASSGVSGLGIFGKVRQSSDTAQASSGEQTVIFSFNEDIHLSTSAWHSTTTNPTRLTVPSSGLYMITGNGSWGRLGGDAGEPGSARLELLVDTTRVIGQSETNVGTGATTPGRTHVSVSALHRFETSTGFVELRGVTNARTASTWVAATTGSITLAAFKI